MDWVGRDECTLPDDLGVRQRRISRLVIMCEPRRQGAGSSGPGKLPGSDRRRVGR